MGQRMRSRIQEECVAELPEDVWPNSDRIFGRCLKECVPEFAKDAKPNSQRINPQPKSQRMCGRIHIEFGAEVSTNTPPNSGRIRCWIHRVRGRIRKEHEAQVTKERVVEVRLTVIQVRRLCDPSSKYYGEVQMVGSAG